MDQHQHHHADQKQSVNLKRHVFAGVLSLCFLALVLFLLWLGNKMLDHLPQKLDVREVSVWVPPAPPPPPPESSYMTEELSVRVQITGEGAAVAQRAPAIQIAALKNKVEWVKPQLSRPNLQQAQWQPLEVQWDTFALDQLDVLPQLLTPLTVRFPKSLSRRGVRRVNVKLEVLIDEHGQVTLIAIVENEYPELVPEIQRLVRKSRFSAPKKDQEPVRARFIWPIVLQS